MDIVITKQDTDFICFLLYKICYRTCPINLEFQDFRNYKRFQRYVYDITSSAMYNNILDTSCLFTSIIYMYRMSTIKTADIDPDDFEPLQLSKDYTTCLILSQKWLIDTSSTLKTWSELSSLSFNDLLINERRILGILQFNLNVSIQEFQFWKQKFSSNFQVYTEKCKKDYNYGNYGNYVDYGNLDFDSNLDFDGLDSIDTPLVQPS